VPGTLGAVCLVLAFFGLAVLPLNYAGLALIAIAISMFVAEAFVTSFGALTVGGIVCLVLGGFMLVDSPAGFMRVSATVVVPVALATAAITVFLVSQIVKGWRAPVRTGDQQLADRTATADDAFHEERGQYVGTVRVLGELWRATSPAPVEAGCSVRIKGRRDLTLEIEPAEE
jgi:membrane-bound serine protease (ClpP class)